MSNEQKSAPEKMWFLTKYYMQVKMELTSGLAFTGNFRKVSPGTKLD